jgi:hypothetical protein
MRADNAGLPDDVSAEALAKEEASGVSNDGRSRGTPIVPGTEDGERCAVSGDW